MKDEGGPLEDEGGPLEDEGGPLGDVGRLEDEGGRLEDEGGPADRLPSSFILHPSSFLEPGPPAQGDEPRRNELDPAPDGDPLARNEPCAPVGGDPIVPNEPAGPRRIADWSVPALVCALLMLLATGLPAAFAGPITGPGGRPSLTPAARAGPAVRVRPFPRRRYRLDEAGQYEPGGLPRRSANAPLDRLPVDRIARDRGE